MTTHHGTASPVGTTPAGARPAATIPAITIRPPWSWAISHGPKRIENRSWTRSYRGPLAIHAGKNWDTVAEYNRHVDQAWRAAGHTTPGPRPGHSQVALGAIVAVADLVDICTVRGGYTDCDCGEWAVPFQCHWKLANVRPLAEPVPCRGAQSLWPLPADVVAAVRAQLTHQVSTHG